MKTIETKAIVTAECELIAKLPPDIPAGEHHVVIVIEDLPARKTGLLPLRFSAYPVGIAKEGFTFRREELYGDDGR